MSRRFPAFLPLLALAPALSLTLGGCIHLLPPPPAPPQLYVLELADVQALQGGPIDAVIAVSNPDGQRTELGTDVVWRSGDTLSYVAHTQWSGRAEDALQAMLAQTMARQGRFRAAVQSGGARADYEVRWNIGNFEVLENGPAITARFQADVSIVESASRRVLAARSFRTEAPVGSRSASIATQALARAAREASAEIGTFAAETAAAAEAQRQAEEAARAAAEAAQTQQAGTSPSRPAPVHHRRSVSRGQRR